MTREIITIKVGDSVVFITETQKDADIVVNHLQKLQEFTYGLNGYTFNVVIMKRYETTPNYSRSPGYLKS